MMRAGIRPMDACYVIDHMREIDQKEIFATRPVTDAEPELLRDVMLSSEAGPSFTWFTRDGVPAAINGYYEQWPGVLNLWAFGTDRWNEVVLSMTKHIRRVIVPELLRTGVHRAECAALHEREDTRRWLPMLGLRLEAVLAGFGRQREDFGLYVWKPDHVQGQRKASASSDDAGGAGRCGSPLTGRSASGTAEVRV